MFAPLEDEITQHDGDENNRDAADDTDHHVAIPSENRLGGGHDYFIAFP